MNDDINNGDIIARDATELESDLLSGARVVPHNTNAEKSVLCAMLISRDACEKAFDKLRAADFYSPTHQDVFAAMIRLYERGTPVDVVTVMDSLETMGKLKTVGGATYISELSIFTPSAANVQYYVDIIKEHSTRRRLMHVGDDLTSDATNTEKDTKDVLNDAERRIFEISMNRAESTLVPVSETIVSTHRRIGELINLGGALSGVPSGFGDLDDLTSGFQKSDLVIIAARPSMGKTAFALNIAAYAAISANASVAVFSLEMPAEQLVMRIMCSEAKVDMKNVRSGKVGAEELSRLADVVRPIERSRLYIDDTGGITVPEIRSKCRRMKMRDGLDMVVIDYLQLLGSKSKSDSRVQVVSELTRSLKILARELDVPILLLSQLSRANEKRSDPRPKMSDLRESGAIEQDADVIIMLHRPSYFDNSGDNTCEVLIEKHRNGPIGVVKLAWIAEYTKFTASTYN